jgi:hypothetical protein
MRPVKFVPKNKTLTPLAVRKLIKPIIEKYSVYRWEWRVQYNRETGKYDYWIEFLYN